MIPFKDIELQDKELITSFTLNSPRRNCDLSFSNLCSWRFLYNTKFAIMDGFLLLKFWADGELVYMMPIGNGDLNKVLDALIEDANREGEPFCLLGICAGMCSELETFMPGRFQFTADRDYADYVYLRSDLATLSGKKFQAKRNHINKFKSLFEDRWSYESMTKDNLEECFQMALKWRAENDCEDDDEKRGEMCVALNSLRLFEELHLTGGVLRIDGKVVAFTIGEPICEDTYVVHIEKAYADVQGAYTMINQQFVEHECMNYKYVNREDDTGAEGLRKAKLSYRPAFMVEKGDVTEKAQG